MDDETIDWEFEGFEVVKADDIDRRAYRFWKGLCTTCGKSPPEVCGNSQMPNDKTTCYPCAEAEARTKKRENK
jgi:hypothetical protein